MFALVDCSHQHLLTDLQLSGKGINMALKIAHKERCVKLRDKKKIVIEKLPFEKWKLKFKATN